MPQLTVIEGSVEDLIVSASDPEQPGKHRVTGVHMGKESICCFFPIPVHTYSCSSPFSLYFSQLVVLGTYWPVLSSSPPARSFPGPSLWARPPLQEGGWVNPHPALVSPTV